MLSDRDFLAINDIDIRNNEFKAIPYILLNICHMRTTNMQFRLRFSSVTSAIRRPGDIHQNQNIQLLSLHLVAGELPWNNHQVAFLAVCRRYEKP